MKNRKKCCYAMKYFSLCAETILQIFWKRNRLWLDNGIAFMMPYFIMRTVYMMLMMMRYSILWGKSSSNAHVFHWTHSSTAGWWVLMYIRIDGIRRFNLDLFCLKFVCWSYFPTVINYRLNDHVVSLAESKWLELFDQILRSKRKNLNRYKNLLTSLVMLWIFSTFTHFSLSMYSTWFLICCCLCSLSRKFPHHLQFILILLNRRIIWSEWM